MSLVKNTKLIFNQIPEGEPTLDTFKVDSEESFDLHAELGQDEIVLKIVAASLDPYMRGRTRDQSVKSYAPAFPLHKPITGHAVAKVLKSNSSKFHAGQHIYGVLPYVTYIKRVAPTDEEDAQNAKFFGGPALRILENKENLPWSVYIGAAGMPGKTAIMAWKEFADAEGKEGKGEVAFVSAGSGPVGQMVIQAARRSGLKVITSAGSESKCNYLRELGADVVFNYKTDDANAIFEKEAPNGINVNWVNVGGKAFETELTHAAVHGRVIVCGWIAGYNGQSDGITNMMQIVAKRLKINGFIVGDLEGKYADEFYAKVPAALASGELKYTEVKYDGFEQAPQAFIDLLAGKQGGGDGIGKVVIEIN